MSARNVPLILLLLISLGKTLAAPMESMADEPVVWKVKKAAEYLDRRQQAWFDFRRADRGTGNNKTSCLCCHTLLTYALARPVLRRIEERPQAARAEQKLLEQTKRRVLNWEDLDSPAFGLMYSFSEQKKRESRGAEAVLNAVILAFDDRYSQRANISDVTSKALDRLWETQMTQGNDKGAWEWLDFGLEPWESKSAKYFGAALAAIAVGTAPGYYSDDADADLKQRVELLKGFLRKQLDDQSPYKSVYNSVWTIWASAKLPGLLTTSQRKQLIHQVLDKQREDGGWKLSSLGEFRRDVDKSDGYATGLILHVLQVAGLSREHPGVSKGLAWLRMNQQPSGEWRAYSVNKDRDGPPHTESRKFVRGFMWDAATAYAVLALSHSN